MFVDLKGRGMRILRRAGVTIRYLLLPGQKFVGMGHEFGICPGPQLV
jgi:hypothetical protein